MVVDNIEILKKIKYDEKGLVPVVVQETKTKDVLMLAYMNEEAILKTLETKRVYYFSRSRNALWLKGETSGHYQDLIRMDYDCDCDTLLVTVYQHGVACHTGEKSCFHRSIYGENEPNEFILEELYQTIKSRQDNPTEKSYTNYLFNQGIDKILKKVGEEASEVIIASKNNKKDEMVLEIADLTYHLLVLMVNQKLALTDIFKELEQRRGKRRES
jgi:phosphoribosyl-AMP cyclohydrolase / phosphoribosyl-ATP pyrophosphohydrolase